MISSIRCGLLGCQGGEEKQTWLSVALRLSAIVLGAIAVIMGGLVFTGVPGLSQLGTIGGWATLSAGAFAMFVAASLKCVNSERLSQKKQVHVNISSDRFEERKNLETELVKWINEDPKKEEIDERRSKEKSRNVRKSYKTPRELAADRILACFDQEDDELDFGIIGTLTSLPSSIGRLYWLQKLYLYNNQFKVLPKEICKLINLKELWLNNNQLQELPPSIDRLEKLEYLDLSQNKLIDLPDQILNFPSECFVEIKENLFLLEVLEKLQTTINHPDYKGPHILLSGEDLKNLNKVS